MASSCAKFTFGFQPRLAVALEASPQRGVDLGGAQLAGIGFDVFGPVEPAQFRCSVEKLAHRVASPVATTLSRAPCSCGSGDSGDECDLLKKVETLRSEADLHCASRFINGNS